MDFLKETDVQKLVRLALSSVRSVMFRNNVAKAWVGQIVKQDAQTITLAYYRPLSAGLHKGSPDLIGWTSVQITPDMVGKTLAVFTAVECKSQSGRISKEQLNFIEVVQKAGGRAGIARDGNEAINLVKF